jgi:hypothetical protein
MKTNVKWLLEPEVFEGEEEPLLATLTKLGVEYEAIKFGKPYEDYLKSFKDTDCVVFHGSLQSGGLYQREAKWIPGVYCNLPKFECVYYYPRLGKNLLNADYIMLPFGELNRRKEWLLETFGDNFFIRPSSGFKTFTGKVVTGETWDKDIRLLGFCNIEPEAIVVVAPSAEIVTEWRLVVVDNKVIAASQYKQKDRQEPSEEVWNYGQKVLDESDYQPDPAWILDVCQIKNGELKVVEVGSFSCCGLYDCDPEPIVQEVSRVAWREWQEYQ